jgi:hypothetical protein
MSLIAKIILCFCFAVTIAAIATWALKDEKKVVFPFKDQPKPLKNAANQKFYPVCIKKLWMIDGDTPKAEFYEGYEDHFLNSANGTMRLIGIDTAETKREKEIAYVMLGNIAHGFAQKWVDEAKKIEVVYNTKKKCKYGRPLVDVKIDGKDLKWMLLNNKIGGKDCPLGIEYKNQNRRKVWGRE